MDVSAQVLRPCFVLPDPGRNGEKTLALAKSLPTALPVTLGSSVADGSPVTLDLVPATHVLLAGAAGMGKSVTVHCILCNVITSFTPADVQLVLIDPKMGIELSSFDVPHLFYPVVENPAAAPAVLLSLLEELARRYRLLKSRRVRNLTDARRNGLAMPYLVVVVEEFPDLVMAHPAAREPLIRLAQTGRAAGVILLLVTQRPAAKIVDQLIRANVPTRLCFRVQSDLESRLVMVERGAEKLQNPGEFLLRTPTLPGLTHGQCPMVSEREIAAAVRSANAQYGAQRAMRPLPAAGPLAPPPADRRKLRPAPRPRGRSLLLKLGWCATLPFRMIWHTGRFLNAVADGAATAAEAFSSWMTRKTKRRRTR